jgi:hypothetical protein
VPRLIVILFSALWLSGCFVADELRHGDAEIERYSVGWREKKKHMGEAEKEASKAESNAQGQQTQPTGPGVQDKLTDWWHETVDEDPVPVDPDDKLVSCEVGGKLKFLRKSDCQLRRGRAAELKSKTPSSATAASKPRPGA